MTATIISFRNGRAVSPGHIAVLAEVLSRDGCRCAHCRAQGGTVVQFGTMGQRDVYVVLDSLEAFDSTSGELVGRVPADAVPVCSSSRIVLDVAFIDHDTGNIGRRGRRPNVMVLCQSCARRHHDEALSWRRAR